MTDAVDLESERERRALELELAGRYRLERELGRGAMAFVYLARDLRHDRPVALKALRAELASAIGPVRFGREIHIVAQLVHPNIVGLIDSGVAEGGPDAPPIPWFVMPYIEGESLRQRLRREAQLPVDDAIRIANDVAEALEYAHHHNVVHRDIKPENILLSGGQAMVADFGVARLVAATDPGLSSSAGIAVGTPYYMSPEQWAAEPNLDGRSDIYSLACVVYEMLSGEPPFTGATAETIRARHRGQPVPPLRVARPSLPPHVEATLERALAKTPADRFRTVTEFTAALQRGEMPRTRRRRWGVPVGLSIAAALGLIALGRWVIRHDQEAGLGLNPAVIGVLPLRNETDLPVARSLVAALTDQLTSRLDTIPGLQVRPQTVMAPLAREPHDIIVQRSGVGTIVSGRVTGTEAALRVTVAVVDGASGQQLGTDDWNAGSEQLLAATDSLADEIVRFVRRAIGRYASLRNRLESVKPAARSLILEARTLLEDATEYRRSRKPVDALWRLRRADSLLQQAGRLDPESAVADIERGWVAVELSDVAQQDSTVAGTWREQVTRGLEHADRALGKEPRTPAALELRGFLYWRRTEWGDTSGFTPAERDLREAVRYNDSLATAWQLLSRIYLVQGNPEDAAAAARRALQHDPFLTEGRPTLLRLFQAELELEEFDDARRTCELGRRDYPGDLNFVECRLVLLAWTGRTKSAVDSAWAELHSIEARRPAGPEISGYRRLLVVAPLARAGLLDSAHGVLRQATARVAHPNDWWEARILALLGDTNGALDRLRAFVAPSPDYRLRIRRDPWFRGLASDPRFRGLVGS